ncbi:MAG: hypothetical protein A2X46_17875 [Lentisphaerae bacterium GWF2_57_35]|nr:MAG: hypothetical protein A2X46_17875 [Lentisphaerae bacterium GWF2_57_35]
MSPRCDGFRRQIGYRKPKKHFHIATEGNETEPRYFELFKTTREDEIQLKIIPSKHKSRPLQVLEHLKLHVAKNGRKGDEAWLVIDRDAWDEAELNDVFREAQSYGYEVALSNPCFELWLYLHMRDNRLFANRHQCQDMLQDVLDGYDPNKKSTYKTECLLPNVDMAIQRAQGLDLHPNDLWPRNQATRVYKLIHRIRRNL